MNHENIKCETEKNYKHEIAQSCHWEISILLLSNSPRISQTFLPSNIPPPAAAQAAAFALTLYTDRTTMACLLELRCIGL